ncbi:MAG: hypothetical protein JNN15_06650 [Blastocatellia bacterium]|nr:hypothetical protein [Blastocatellia bacterium]
MDNNLEKETFEGDEQISKLSLEDHIRLAEQYFNAWGGLTKGLPILKEEKRQELTTFNLADKGYGLRHLATHLELSGKVAELHKLLALEDDQGRNLWYRTKKHFELVDSYAKDVERALKLADKSEQAISLQLKYLLILSSINKLNTSLYPDLVEELIKTELWSSSRAFQYAKQVGDEAEQVEFLLMLIPLLPKDTLDSVFLIAEKMQDEINKEEVLSVLTQYLPIEVLTATMLMNNEISRAKVLTQLVKHLPEAGGEIYGQVLAAVETMEDELSRVDILGNLAEHAPNIRNEVSSRLLKIADETEHNYVRTDIFTKLATYSTDTGLLNRAVEIAENSKDEQARRDILLAVVKHISSGDELFVKVLDLAEKITDDKIKAEFFTALSKFLPERKEELLGKVFTAVDSIEDENLRFELLSSLVKDVPQKVLAAVENIGDEYVRAKLLTSLVDFLPDKANEILSKALEASEAILDDEVSKGEALSALAPHIPEKLLSAVDKIRDDYSKALAMAVLAQHVPDRQDLAFRKQALLDTALQVARTSQGDDRKTDILTTLAKQLPEKVLEVAKTISDEYIKEDVLVALSSSVPEQVLAETSSLNDQFSKANILNALAVVLAARPAEDLAKFWPQVVSILSTFDRPTLLSNLTKYIEIVQKLGATKGNIQEAIEYSYKLVS